MGDMTLYDAVRRVPEAAKKPIMGGKLKGKTDINPMWRIKMLTEQFGICGVGWYYLVLNRWTEPGARGEVTAWVEIHLFIKVAGEWSQPIYGVGGSMLIDTQRDNLATNDDAYKMATTDAISVACKQLGFGADVYWDSDKTKYNKADEPEKTQPKEPTPPPSPSSPSVPPTTESKPLKERVNNLLASFARGSQYDKNTNKAKLVKIMDTIDPAKKSDMGNVVAAAIQHYVGAQGATADTLSETVFNSVVADLVAEFVK